jgi:DNA-binding transcriptional LysR family regulator
VAELASVSAAAQEMGLPKSVVSKRIAQLEHIVQATLFSRSTRRIALTSAGVIYLDFARSALDSMSKAEERLRDLRQELTGEIRLTAPVSWGQRVLARAIAEFLAQHPGIEIDLRLDDRRLDLAYEGFDIALRMSPSHPPEMMAVPLYELEWRICGSPEYLASGGTPLIPADLQAHPCISYWRVWSDQDWVLKSGEETIKVRVAGPLRANNPEAVAEAALSGMGLALLPLYICQRDIADGRLVEVLTGWQPQTKFGDMIFAVAPIERMRLSRNKCFLEFLREKLSAGTARRAQLKS